MNCTAPKNVRSEKISFAPAQFRCRKMNTKRKKELWLSHSIHFQLKAHSFNGWIFCGISAVWRERKRLIEKGWQRERKEKNREWQELTGSIERISRTKPATKATVTKASHTNVRKTTTTTTSEWKERIETYKYFLIAIVFYCIGLHKNCIV